MRFIALLVLSLALLPAARAVAATPVQVIDPILLSSETPDTLRARLAALATSSHAPDVAAEAWRLCGMSYERWAMPDSAIACYRRALEVEHSMASVNALADALVRRRTKDDAAEAVQLLEHQQPVEQEPDIPTARGDVARLGWAYVVSGQAAHGLDVLTPVAPRLANDPVWCYRLARTYLASNHFDLALPLVMGLNTAARGQDHEIAALLKHLDKLQGESSRIPDQTQQALRDHDDAEIAALARIRGRRVRLLASDGAMIGGVLFADSAAKRVTRAAIVLGEVGGELHDYDSLSVALRSNGFAMFLLDPRGCGWSVAPEFSLPDTWEGRQGPLSARVARDVSDALDAFAHVARIDTTRVLLIGVGSMSPVAIAAAARDRRIGSLALLDPRTSPVERGAVLATARRAPVPAFIQLTVGARGEGAFVDTLSRTFPQGVSRLVEAVAFVPGAAAFGSRPGVTQRFVHWVGDTFSARPVRRATPRATPPAR